MRSPSSLATRFKFLKEILARLIVVEEPESLEDLVLGVAIEDLVRHHLQELFIFDGARSVIVHIADHLLDLFFLGLEAERAHRDLQLLCIDVAAAIGVEEIEGLLDLLLLLLRQLLLLLPSSVKTTKCHVFESRPERGGTSQCTS